MAGNAGGAKFSNEFELSILGAVIWTHWTTLV
jgi:hypothetical protein